MAYHSSTNAINNNGSSSNVNGSSSGNYSGDDRDSRSVSGPGHDERLEDPMDKPIYLLEHLATFTVNKESGIVYPADGMRRLLQLEKTTGIWSQKMQLCLDKQWVLIMDYETGNIIERFPASLIKEPTAFTSNGPMEMYNNILVFIVGGSPGSRSEMHIFQCQSISAIHLVEDLKILRSGKALSQHRETLPPPPSFIKSQASLGAYVRHSERHHNSESNAGFSNYNHDTDSELGVNLGGANDETSSTSSEKYERDVTVLNHCFDDIEKFIARLQHAAAASRELERRRRNRKSKKKDPGEGLLTLRTKPPHEKEFIDIFAKFKLSFNLLAKLKAHIHDPNAPELVHFLFTPLALIVDASHDTYYDPNLPARVVNPLLTREAINLLINCVTSKETELWRSLGDAWAIPRDQWKGHIGSYHPVFFDGWSPDYPVMDELNSRETPPPNTPGSSNAIVHASQASQATSAAANAMKRRVEQQQQHYSIDYDFDPQSLPGDKYNAPASPAHRDFSARSDISIDSIERNGGPSMVVTGNGQNLSHDAMLQHQSIDAWLDDLHTRRAKIVQVTYPRTANNDKELTVTRGEYLEILDDSRKWWKARNMRGQVAHVPHTIITPFSYNGSNANNSGTPVTPDNGGDMFNNAYTPQKQAYTKSNPINRQSNDNVSDRYTQYGNDNHQGALATNSADWVRNKHIATTEDSDKVNCFGSNYLTHSTGFQNSKHPPPPPPLPDSTMKSSSTLNRDSNRLSKSMAVVTAPPVVRRPSDSTKVIKNENVTIERERENFKSNQSSINNNNNDDMQEELKQVLSLFREKRRTLDIIKTPEIYIQQSSTAAEVKQWLRAKGFSENVVRKLNDLNGNELFLLTRETLEDYCGVDEGRRLASQITIQRNVSGYKTARSSELQAFLAKARKKADEQTSNE